MHDPICGETCASTEAITRCILQALLTHGLDEFQRWVVNDCERKMPEKLAVLLMVNGVRCDITNERVLDQQTF